MVNVADSFKGTFGKWGIFSRRREKTLTAAVEAANHIVGKQTPNV